MRSIILLVAVVCGQSIGLEKVGRKGSLRSQEALGGALIRSSRGHFVPLFLSMVRKLRGSAKKESRLDKKERRAANAVAKQRLLTVVLPVLLAVAIIIAGLVYLASRKK